MKYCNRVAALLLAALPLLLTACGGGGGGNNHVELSLSGTITLSGSGQPLPNITVNADIMGGKSTTTTMNGNYSFGWISNGQTVVVTPTSPAYIFNPPSRTVLVQGSPATGIDFTATLRSAEVNAGPAFEGLEQQIEILLFGSVMNVLGPENIVLPRGLYSGRVTLGLPQGVPGTITIREIDQQTMQ
ncbi:MAG: hypothetical protein KDD44_02895, partial [Bdellovibrionales bacterium]|nr:hypothetical protein [Bdellovibrionales bacterium]